MTEEEESANPNTEVNSDALEALFVEETSVEEEEIAIHTSDIAVDEDDADEIDIAFQANDEGYW